MSIIEELSGFYSEPMVFIITGICFALGLFMGRFIARKQYVRLFILVTICGGPFTLLLLLLGSTNYIIFLQFHLPFIAGLVPQVYFLLQKRH
jgi:hypothetical protein